MKSTSKHELGQCCILRKIRSSFFRKSFTTTETINSTIKEQRDPVSFNVTVAALLDNFCALRMHTVAGKKKKKRLEINKCTSRRIGPPDALVVKTNTYRLGLRRGIFDYPLTLRESHVKTSVGPGHVKRFR